MFAMCKEVHPASGVEHAVSCRFFSATTPEKNLVVGGVNFIRVYKLAVTPDEEEPDEIIDEELPKKTPPPPKAKLECASSFPVCGTIADMAPVRLAGSSRDALVLCFRDAKVSVVEYDPYSHSLKTVSLHYFEEEASANGWTENWFIPRVVVDPENRAAAVTIFGSKLAVIPFRRDVLGTSGGATAAADGDGQTADELPSPVMTSYVIELKEVDSKIDAVLDAQFLHGYYEPTLLVLFEPLKTFSGRVLLRPDTCSMVSMSLNTYDGSHPVIWSVTGLPFDCFQAVPVSRPIGGCLIVAVNSLIYLNQSMPPYGVAVNCIPASTTGFPLKPLTQEGVSLSMDCARIAIVKEPDLVVMSVANGDLWLITLVSDGMMAVRGFHFDKAASAVIATCLSPVEDGYLFLGSRLGNSQLLRYFPKDQIRLDIVKSEAKLSNGSASETEKESGQVDETIVKDEFGPPKKKRKKTEEKSDALADWMAQGVEQLADADEIEVYYGPEKAGDEDADKNAEPVITFATFGAGGDSANRIVSYTFESCDSLINIGPCGRLSLGQPAFLSQEFWSNDRTDLDLLTTSGFGKGGALCVMHRSLRPQVITTFELPGCIDMWTVVGDKGSGVHDFLIMSLTNSTMVLETGEELNEVESGGFVTNKPTVFACNLGNDRYTVQVTAFSMVLLRGKEVVQTAHIDVKNAIIMARAADPYIVLLGAGGEVKLAKLVEPRGSVKPYMDVIFALPIQQSRAVAISTYTDYSGMFAAAGPSGSSAVPPTAAEDAAEVLAAAAAAETQAEKVTSSLFDRGGDVVDEDELLYGEADPSLLTSFADKAAEAAGGSDSTSDKRKNAPPLVTQWVFLARQNGNLEIYSLPDFSTKFLVRQFSLGPYVLTNSMTDTWTESKILDVPIVKELLVVGLGVNKGTERGNASLKPMLFAFVGEDLFIYEAFPFFEGKSLDDPYIKVRFRKVEHEFICRSSLSARTQVKQEKGTYTSSRLVHFSEVGSPTSYTGVFIAGPYPHWALMGSRGDLKIHPMSIDGPIKCFAPFDNVNCPKGFLYFNGKEEMRICLFPSQLNYDCPWPTRKVPLKSTPRFLVYHVETKTYAVATSSEKQSSKMYRFNGEDKELVEETRPDNFPLPSVVSFAVQLFSPVSWDVIPETKIAMEDYEHITDMKNVQLTYEGAASGFKGYIAMSTNYIYGEDITCRGRILIMDVLDVVPEPGRPLTKNKMKEVYAKEQKGPVTSIAAVRGFLVSAIGQKIYIWQLKDGDLVGIAFIDTQIYTHQILCLKNFILVADMYKSITLLQFQENYRTICVIGRDMNELEVYGTEFYVCDKSLGFIATDRDRNIAVFGYHPEARETSGVSRLVRKADVHVGSNINQLLRIKAKVHDPSGCLRPGQPKFGDRRHVTWYGTLDGGLGWVLPLHEVHYRVLMSVQNTLHTFMPHLGGLNPKAHRKYRMGGRRGPGGNVNPAKNVVDGNLVFKYLHLPLTDKLEVTKRTGMSIEEITDVLQECSRVTDLF